MATFRLIAFVAIVVLMLCHGWYYWRNVPLLPHKQDRSSSVLLWELHYSDTTNNDDSTNNNNYKHDQQKNHRQHRQQQHYYISSASVDGIGHQIEAKLSCLATALMMSSPSRRMTYVHQPIVACEHGEDPHEMERLFNIQTALSHLPPSLALVYDPQVMQLQHNHALPPFLGRCNNPNNVNQREWMKDTNNNNNNNNNIKNNNNLHNTSSNNNNNKIVVETSDNCWDYFWCHTDQLIIARHHRNSSAWKDVVVPLLRKAILHDNNNNNINNNNNNNNNQNKTTLLTIACHLRLGDAGPKRSANFEWYHQILHQLIKAAAAKTNIIIIITTVHHVVLNKFILQCTRMGHASNWSRGCCGPYYRIWMNFLIMLWMWPFTPKMMTTTVIMQIIKIIIIITLLVPYPWHCMTWWQPTFSWRQILHSPMRRHSYEKQSIQIIMLWIINSSSNNSIINQCCIHPLWTECKMVHLEWHMMSISNIQYYY